MTKPTYQYLWVPFLLWLSWYDDWNALPAFAAGMWFALLFAWHFGWRKVH